MGGLFGPYYVRNDDPGASGAAYIVSPIRAGFGTATYTFYVQKDTTYYFWLRVIAPDETHYAMQFQVETGGEKWTNNLLAGRRGPDWQWTRVLNSSQLTASARLTRGLHKIILTGLHENVKIDKILLTPRSGYDPSPFGTNYVATLMTDAEGFAGTKMKLSDFAGANHVEIRCFGVADGETFIETGLAAAPKIMDKTNDNQPATPARTALTKPFIVTLFDSLGTKCPTSPSASR